MAWTAAIDAIIEAARHIERTIIFEVQNGHQAENVPATWSNFVVVRGGWGISRTEGAPAADSLRCNVAMDNFVYFEEFNHANPLQKFAYCRLLMIIYLGTVTPGTGTLVFAENSRFVTGNATTFTTELDTGSIIQVGEFRGYVRQVINNTSLELFEVSADTVAMPGIAFDIVDDERQYIFRGLIEDGQQENANYVIEAMDLLHKLKSAICVLDMESDSLAITGPAPSGYVQLRHATHFDVGTGGQYTYEIDPTVAGQAGAEDIFGNNRAFVPGVIEVVDNTVALPPGNPVSPAEYVIDCPYGLIRFSNDQTPAPPPTFFIPAVSVYLEGTLELADILEAMLQYDPECTGVPDSPGLGPGFTDALLQTPLTGTFTLTNGAVFVGGVGTAFLTELEAGDRIALDATSDDKGIVASITTDILLVLKYPYKGATAGPATGFVSSLKEAEISVSNLRWWKCDGTCADLLRHLRDYYADSKGYRVWFDHLDNLIRGERVAISATDIIDLAPKTNLRITNTTENFASAIGASGTLGRAKNLATDPATTMTGIAQNLPLVGASLWVLGAATGGGTSWGGMTWPVAEPPPAVDNTIDTNMATAYMVYRNENSGDPDYPLDTNWYQLMHIDLGAEYDLEQIDVYAPNCKNTAQFQYGISIHKSAAFAGPPVADLGALTPETYHRNIAPDEHLSFDLTSAGKIQYMVVLMRPIKWPTDGGSRTMGLRELIIFGSQRMCEIVCIQGVTCPGRLQAQAGTITFNAGGPPWMATGVGTNFGGPVGTTPQIGDSLSLNATPLVFGYIEEILTPTSCRLALEYPGVPGANGAYSRAMWPSLDTAYPIACVESQGGHFIGGSALDTDFIVDYYPTLLAKMHHTQHRIALDDANLVFTEAQAIDRAYIILNEMIRLYREIHWSGMFDPRIQLYDTVRTVDDYRATANETLTFLVEAVSLSDDNTTITGTEYGAGVLQ